VTANEPRNPYTAPTAPAAGAVPVTSRLLASATTVLAYPLMGAGFIILGKPRRFAAWATVGALLVAATIIGIRVPAPKLCVAGIQGMFLTILLAIIHTAVTKPGDGLTGGRAWLVAIALVLAAKGSAQVVKHTLIEAFKMPSGSMAPTLLPGDHMFVKKGRSGVGRGDVVVFEFPHDRGTDYVKRVVAMGGDTVEIRNGIVLVNGADLAQAQIKNEPNPCPGEMGAAGCWFARETEPTGARTYTIMFEGHAAADAPRVSVPEGHVFVLGDNRDNSFDSRQWGFVPIDHIKGKATVIWWSGNMSRIGRGIN
jgi:signal peptidase I